MDTLRNIETPEGVALKLHCAGLFSRAMAWLVDVLIRIGIYIAIAMIIGFSGLDGDFFYGIFLIILFLMEWFYPVLFEVLRNGKTPGKSVLGIHVLHDDGTPIGWSASMTRNLLRTADFFPLFYGAGVLSLILNKDFKRLGDLAAGTVVVYDRPKEMTHELPNVDAEHLPLPLSQDEQRAIVGLAERHQRMTTERQEEIARICEPLTKNEAHPLKRIWAYANFIAGKQA